MDSTDPNGLFPTLPRASQIIYGRKNPKPLRRARDRGEIRVYRLGDRWERVYLPEESIEAQIDRVAFELQMNLRYYLSHCPYRGARRATIPEDDLLRVVAEARAVLYRYRDAAAAPE